MELIKSKEYNFEKIDLNRNLFMIKYGKSRC
jgi:hypothetical protein